MTLPANIRVVLWGQSNADWMINEGSNTESGGGGFYSIMQTMLMALLGVPVVCLARITDGSSKDQTLGYSIAAGAGTFQIENNGAGPADPSLLLVPGGTFPDHATDPSTWPLGAHGTGLVTYFKNVVAPAGKLGDPIFILHFQSENDSVPYDDQMQRYYHGALQHIVAAVRAAIPGQPIATFPICHSSPAFWENVHAISLNAIRAAWLTEINNAATNSHWGFGNGYDTIDRGAPPGDGSHSVPLGDYQFAWRMAVHIGLIASNAGWSANNLSKLPKLGFYVNQVKRVAGSTTELDCLGVHDQGNDLIVPSIAAGWMVYDATHINQDNYIHVTSAVRLNSTTIRITAASAPAGTDAQVGVDFCAQNDFTGRAYGTDPVADVGVSLPTDNWHTLASTQAQPWWPKLQAGAAAGPAGPIKVQIPIQKFIRPIYVATHPF